MRNGALVVVSPDEGQAFQETVGWSCFLHGVWEPHVERCLRALLNSGDAAIDVGANLGYFSAAMAQAVGPLGRVVAFEPVPATYARLSQLAALNGFVQLSTFPLALGADAGDATIHWDPRVAGSASLHTGQGERVAVRVRPLDALVAEGSVPAPRLVKIDVEGHELAVLRGARETIARSRPAIIFELNAAISARAGWRPADIAAELPGYAFRLLEPTGERDIDLTAFDLRADEYVDVLGLPLDAR
jgi:FkbM family methyltransferase